MTRRIRLLALFTVAVICAAAFHGLLPRIASAPQIVITDIDGGKTDLGALRGRPVLVTFWSSDCPGCLREMPALTRLYQDFSPQGLQVVGVAVAWDRPDYVLATARSRQLPYRVGLDIDGKVATAFGDVSQTPTSFLVGPDGRIRYHSVGAMDIDRVRALIVSMLPQPVVGTTAFNGR